MAQAGFQPSVDGSEMDVSQFPANEREKYYTSFKEYQAARQIPRVFAEDAPEILDLQDGLSRSRLDVAVIGQRELPQGGVVQDRLQNTARPGEEGAAAPQRRDFGLVSPDESHMKSLCPGTRSNDASLSRVSFSEGLFQTNDLPVIGTAEQRRWDRPQGKRDDPGRSSMWKSYIQTQQEISEDQDNHTYEFRLQNPMANVPDNIMRELQPHGGGRMSERELRREMNTRRFKESENSALGRGSYASYGI